MLFMPLIEEWWGLTGLKLVGGFIGTLTDWFPFDGGTLTELLGLPRLFFLIWLLIKLVKSSNYLSVGIFLGVLASLVVTTTGLPVLTAFPNSAEFAGLTFNF